MQPMSKLCFSIVLWSFLASYFCNLAQSEEPPVVELDGYYLLASAPAAFRTLQWVELREDSGAANNISGSIRLSKKVSSKSFENWKLASVALAGNNLSFRSVEKAGHSYGFSGRFLKTGNLSEVASDSEVVLSGRLTEFAKNKAVAEENVEFTYSIGD